MRSGVYGLVACIAVLLGAGSIATAENSHVQGPWLTPALNLPPGSVGGWHIEQTGRKHYVLRHHGVTVSWITTAPSASSPLYPLWRRRQHHEEASDQWWVQAGLAAMSDWRYQSHTVLSPPEQPTAELGRLSRIIQPGRKAAPTALPSSILFSQAWQTGIRPQLAASEVAPVLMLRAALRGGEVARYVQHILPAGLDPAQRHAAAAAWRQTGLPAGEWWQGRDGWWSLSLYAGVAAPQLQIRLPAKPDDPETGPFELAHVLPAALVPWSRWQRLSPDSWGVIIGLEPAHHTDMLALTALAAQAEDTLSRSLSFPAQQVAAGWVSSQLAEVLSDAIATIPLRPQVRNRLDQWFADWPSLTASTGYLIEQEGSDVWHSSGLPWVTALMALLPHIGSGHDFATDVAQAESILRYDFVRYTETHDPATFSDPGKSGYAYQRLGPERYLARPMFGQGPYILWEPDAIGGPRMTRLAAWRDDNDDKKIQSER